MSNALPFPYYFPFHLLLLLLLHPNCHWPHLSHSICQRWGPSLGERIKGRNQNQVTVGKEGRLLHHLVLLVRLIHLLYLRWVVKILFLMNRCGLGCNCASYYWLSHNYLKSTNNLLTEAVLNSDWYNTAVEKTLGPKCEETINCFVMR